MKEDHKSVTINLTKEEARLVSGLLFCHSTGSVMRPIYDTEASLIKYRHSQDVAHSLFQRLDVTSDIWEDDEQ